MFRNNKGLEECLCEIKALEATISTLKSELDYYKQRNSTPFHVQEYISRIEHKMQRQQAILNDKEGEVVLLKERIKDLKDESETRVKELNEAVEIVEEVIRTYNEDTKKYEKALQDDEDLIQCLNDELGALSMATQKQDKKRVYAINFLKDQRRTLRTDLTIAKETIDAKERLLNAQDIRIQEMMGHNRVLRDKLHVLGTRTDLLDEIQALKKELVRLDGNNNTLEQGNKNLQKMLKACQKDLLDAVRDKDEMEELLCCYCPEEEEELDLDNAEDDKIPDKTHEEHTKAMEH